MHVLQSMTEKDVRMYIRTRVKLYAPPHFVAWGASKTSTRSIMFKRIFFGTIQEFVKIFSMQKRYNSDVKRQTACMGLTLSQLAPFLSSSIARR